MGILIGGAACAAVLAMLLSVLFKPTKNQNKALKVLCYGAPVMVFIACLLAMGLVDGTIDALGLVGGCFVMSCALVGTYMAVLRKDAKRLDREGTCHSGNADADPIERSV